MRYLMVVLIGVLLLSASAFAEKPNFYANTAITRSLAANIEAWGVSAEAGGDDCMPPRSELKLYEKKFGGKCECHVSDGQISGTVYGHNNILVCGPKKTTAYAVTSLASSTPEGFPLISELTHEEPVAPKYIAKRADYEGRPAYVMTWTFDGDKMIQIYAVCTRAGLRLRDCNRAKLIETNGMGEKDLAAWMKVHVNATF